jgi:DNA polymerase-3 subunit delta
MLYVRGMAQKKSHEVDPWIASAQTAPIMLVYGPDRGLVAERARRIADKTELPLDDPFSVIRMDAAEADQDPGRLTDEVRTVPMFAATRLVWLRGAGAQKRLADEVKALVADPPRDAILLIEAGDLRKGSPLRSAVEQASSAMALPCYSDDARALEAIIDAELQRAGLTIELEARQLLKASLGGDRLATRGEMEKLALYCAGQSRVGVEDVRALIGDVSALGADEAVDHVLSGQVGPFDAMFSRLMESGANPFVVLSAALRQFQLLQRLRGTMDNEGKPAAAAVAGARPPVFFSRRKTVEGALARWDASGLAAALDRLQATILRTRQMPDIAVAATRQALLILAIEAARSRRS